MKPAQSIARSDREVWFFKYFIIMRARSVKNGCPPLGHFSPYSKYRLVSVTHRAQAVSPPFFWVTRGLHILMHLPDPVTFNRHLPLCVRRYLAPKFKIWIFVHTQHMTFSALNKTRPSVQLKKYIKTIIDNNTGNCCIGEKKVIKCYKC